MKRRSKRILPLLSTMWAAEKRPFGGHLSKPAACGFREIIATGKQAACGMPVRGKPRVTRTRGRPAAGGLGGAAPTGGQSLAILA